MNKQIRAGIGMMLGFGMTLAPGAGATVAPVQADTFLGSNGGDKTKNFGSDMALKVGPPFNALLRFDLSTIPAGTVATDVQKATVLLWVNKVDSAGSVVARPVTSAWTELGVTYNTPLSVGTALPTVPVPTVNQYLLIDVTAQVQGWLTTPGSNNGLMLTAAGGASFQLDSKENNGIAPLLDVSLAGEGPTGAAATIAVGTVSTSAPGSTATVTNAGTSAAAVFNFTIPQGAIGVTGATGAAGGVGPTGSQGSTGPTGSQGSIGATGTTGPAGPSNVTGNITLVDSTATAGNIMKVAAPFIHNFGSHNTFVGKNAGNFSMSVAAVANTATGESALGALTNGQDNTAVGSTALAHNSFGSSNTAIGSGALNQNISGADNTAVGYIALANNSGSSNTAIGSQALNQNTTGVENTAIGYTALKQNSGSSNTAIGFQALGANTTGNHNTAIGDGALGTNVSGSSNIAIGAGAGAGRDPGSNNIFIGAVGTDSDTARIRIGTPGVQTATFIAGIFGATVGAAAPVLVGFDGQLATAVSSRRYKDDIADMNDASAGLMQLRPVTFHYKSDRDNKSRLLQYGLIAEEVAAVYPGLVVRSANGQIETVLYQFLAPMLLNQYQKQQHTIEAQAMELTRQMQSIAALEQDRRVQTARLDALEHQAWDIAALKQQMAELARRSQVVPTAGAEKLGSDAASTVALRN